MTEEGQVDVPLDGDTQISNTNDDTVTQEDPHESNDCNKELKELAQDPTNFDDNSNCSRGNKNEVDVAQPLDADGISEMEIANDCPADIPENDGRKVVEGIETCSNSANSPESIACDAVMEKSSEESQIMDVSHGDQEDTSTTDIAITLDETSNPETDGSNSNDVVRDAMPIPSPNVSSKPCAGASAEPSTSKTFDALQSVYYLKKFKWAGDEIQIVTQNENGPCPLLAIANVLVLSKRIFLPPMQECITASQLMEYIGDYILTAGPKNVDEAMLLNYQQNMHDAISIMHKLQTGIDVNVRFTGPRDFEFTSECLVFDLLNIGLYHGWLVDPQDKNLISAVGSLSYNQLVEKIIKSKESCAQEDAISEGLLAETFLEGSASQLTYHGICELNNAVRDEELCVFFRNNHFGTLYKHKGELFLLVTDQGYLNQSRIIWETLANVDGAGQFVDENFHTVGPLLYQSPSADPTPPSEHPVQGDQLSQEDKDYLIALSLQEEQNPQQGNKQHHSGIPESTSFSPQQQEANDLALAKRLQDEEQQFARQQQQQQRQRLEQQNQQHVRQPQNQFPYHQYPRNQQGTIENQSMDTRNQEKCVIL